MASPDVELLQQRARLQALTEVHEYWEFEDASEEVFDAWMHERIKATRQRIAALEPAKESGRPCGCDEGADWKCEQHR